MDSLTALRQTFFQECEEQLGELELGLVAMDEGDTGSETVNAVFRAVHSIKGGAGAFKLERLVKFAHTFETTLDMIRSERLVATSAVLKTMLRSSDALADLVKAARTGEELDESRTAPLLEELKDYTESVQTASASGEPSAEAEIDRFPTGHVFVRRRRRSGAFDRAAALCDRLCAVRRSLSRRQRRDQAIARAWTVRRAGHCLRRQRPAAVERT